MSSFSLFFCSVSIKCQVSPSSESYISTGRHEDVWVCYGFSIIMTDSLGYIEEKDSQFWMGSSKLFRCPNIFPGWNAPLPVQELFLLPCLLPLRFLLFLPLSCLPLCFHWKDISIFWDLTLYICSHPWCPTGSLVRDSVSLRASCLWPLGPSDIAPSSPPLGRAPLSVSLKDWRERHRCKLVRWSSGSRTSPFRISVSAFSLSTPLLQPVHRWGVQNSYSLKRPPSGLPWRLGFRFTPDISNRLQSCSGAIECILWCWKGGEAKNDLLFRFFFLKWRLWPRSLTTLVLLILENIF